MTAPPPLPPSAKEGSVASTVRSITTTRPGRPSEVWRGAAFALLRLNPKECDALAIAFEESQTTDDQRGLILDLLAGAGTFEAQVVMRRLLSLAVARRECRTFATFVQRLGFVEQPDGPTLRFLMSIFAEAKNEPHDVFAACAYALGASAGQAHAAGDVEHAIRASDVLRRALGEAKTALEKGALVTALGNAGVFTDVAAIIRVAGDADPSVRAAAALALRKIANGEARAQLIEMLTDASPRVTESALCALSEQKLAELDLERLAAVILAGRTPHALDGRILRVLVAQRPQFAPGRAPALENALRLLLGRVEAQISKTPSESGDRHRIVEIVPKPILESGIVPAVRPGAYRIAQNATVMGIGPR